MIWPLHPVWVIDVTGAICMIILSILCLGVARTIVRRDPENPLGTYLLWFSFAIVAFSLSRSLGHIIKYYLHFRGLDMYWRKLAPVSGSINSVTFVYIGAVTLFFHRMEKIIRRMTRDKRRIERTSREIISLNREMESIVRERTTMEMAFRLAHKIRNPVTIIGGLIRRILKKAPRDKSEEEKLKEVLAQAKKLELLVTGFEGLYLEKQKHFLAVDLNDLIDDARELIQFEAEEKGIATAFHRKLDGMTFFGDVRLMKIAVVHLLRNAIDGCDPGGRINIAADRHENLLELTIEDTGRGIPEKILSHIFDPLHRTAEGETGLGLPYIRQIIEEHKGTISIKSREGKGTTVTIHIPPFFPELKRQRPD